jgi:hypothetical protein
MLGAWKEALDYEKRNYSILVKILSDSRDPRIEESDMLLKQYTEKVEEGK